MLLERLVCGDDLFVPALAGLWRLPRSEGDLPSPFTLGVLDCDGLFVSGRALRFSFEAFGLFVVGVILS